MVQREALTEHGDERFNERCTILHAAIQSESVPYTDPLTYRNKSRDVSLRIT